MVSTDRLRNIPLIAETQGAGPRQARLFRDYSGPLQDRQLLDVSNHDFGPNTNRVVLFHKRD